MPCSSSTLDSQKAVPQNESFHFFAINQIDSSGGQRRPPFIKLHTERSLKPELRLSESCEAEEPSSGRPLLVRTIGSTMREIYMLGRGWIGAT